MPNIIFNTPLYFTIYIHIYIYIYIYTELAPKLTATASVAQLVQRWSRDTGSGFNIKSDALKLHFSQVVRVGS